MNGTIEDMVFPFAMQTIPTDRKPCLLSHKMYFEGRCIRLDSSANVTGFRCRVRDPVNDRPPGITKRSFELCHIFSLHEKADFMSSAPYTGFKRVSLGVGG